MGLLPADAIARSADVPLRDEWRSYVLAPPGRQVAPVAVLAAAGEVADPDGALAPGGGAARLTLPPGTPEGGEPYLELDFGKIVAGRLEVGFAGASAPPPGVRVAFSESRRYLGPRSDFSRSDVAPRDSPPPGTDNHVPAPGGGV